MGEGGLKGVAAVTGSHVGEMSAVVGGGGKDEEEEEEEEWRRGRRGGGANVKIQ